MPEPNPDRNREADGGGARSRIRVGGVGPASSFSSSPQYRAGREGGPAASSPRASTYDWRSRSPACMNAGETSDRSDAAYASTRLLRVVEPLDLLTPLLGV
ncbi:hypothetical protein KCU59_g42, partial [Aureobasidium melanogenum]